MRNSARIRRSVLALAALAAGLVGVTPSPANSVTAAPAPLPLYQFVNSGSGPLPWNAASLAAQTGGGLMVGGPHGTQSATTGALAYRTSTGDVAVATVGASGVTNWQDLFASQIVAGTPAADPVPLIDPSGNVDALYVDTTGHLVLLSPNDPVTPTWLHLHAGAAWRPEVATDLTAITGVSAAAGLPSVSVNGSVATIAFRTTQGTVALLTLTWGAGETIPGVPAPAIDLVALTGGPSVTSDPVIIPGPIPAVAAVTTAHHLVVFSQSVAGAWVYQDLTQITRGPAVNGPLVTGSSSVSVYVAGLTAGGNATLFAAPLTSFNSAGAISNGPPVTTTTSVGQLARRAHAGTPATSTTTTVPPTTTTTTTTVPPTTTTTLPTPSSTYPWTVLNVTGDAPGSPPLTGSLYMAVAPSGQVTIAGGAANWGDLFTLTSPNGVSSWIATDVSVTAGNGARTVGSVVTGVVVGGVLSLFAAGISAPPPQGVGVYAIPSAKWTQAALDGWPILSETGGLGTTSSPWVGWVGTKSLTSSSDYVMGQSIYSAHKRVTWLSFWTVSGPLSGEALAPATYYRHGFAAGAWVATQIDAYRASGLGLKPDWVILDPEGYPDAHSGLDAPGGATTATMATYTGYWSAMVKGWAQGIASVDPSLNPGVYASQSEYRNYHLAGLPYPVFEALAFSGGGPVPIAGAHGSNIRGFIAFSAACSPATTLQSETSTLLTSPWGGQFNTLQFNAGVYCPPPGNLG